MRTFDPSELKTLHVQPKDAHKGMGGKLTIVGGSHLFHGASLFALKVASRIVDMVFYASIPKNNELTQRLKSELYDFIAVPREKVVEYIEESDAVLIGPGLPREEGREEGEEQTRQLTERLLKKIPAKKWIIDAGSLTEMRPSWLTDTCIITPHRKEFEALFQKELPMDIKGITSILQSMVNKYGCTILLKGPVDIVCGSKECVRVEGGNEGMTKGGTGDVLAGLVAALACKNDLFLAAAAGSFINKYAGDRLYKRVGPYFNASDLTDEIPRAMKGLIIADSSVGRQAGRVGR